nr:MAG TPA: hypothetical protein [Caudoviricetes sp.]
MVRSAASVPPPVRPAPAVIWTVFKAASVLFAPIWATALASSVFSHRVRLASA